MSLWAADNVHPNDAGHDAIAAMLFEALTAGDAIPLVDFSPTTGPFDTPDWISLSDGGPHGNRIWSADWVTGKQADLSDFAPGQGSIVLRNDDRLFDPEYADGDYFGQLNPRVPFRIRAYYGGTTYDLFYGFVDGGWEQGYQPPAVSTCTVTLIDLLGVIAGYKLLPVLRHELLADAPAALWGLDETEGTVMADRSGNSNHGLYDNAILGSDPLVIDPAGKSMTSGPPEVVQTSNGRGIYQGTTLPTALPVTFEAWVQTERDLTLHKTIISVQRDFASAEFVHLSVGASAYTPDGEVAIHFGVGGALVARGNTRVDDGEAHHVAMTMTSTAAADIKLYVDGVLQTQTIVFNTTGGAWPNSYLWTVGDWGLGNAGFDGQLDEVAVYDSALSAARILAHYEAGSTAFAGLRSDEQVQWVLDTIGVPAAMYDLDEGQSFMGQMETGGKDALAVIRDIARTEQGGFYVNHADGGVLKFRQRFASYQDTRSTIAQATFSDDGTATDGDVARVVPGSLQVEPNGIDTVINQATVDWLGGQETVDASAGSPYGPRGVSIATLATSSALARGVAQWVIALNETPKARIRSLEIDPSSNPVEFPLALGARIGDRVDYRSHPQQVGDATTKALEVLGTTGRIEGREWAFGFYLTASPSADVDLFTLGTSELGGTHILAY